MKKIILTLMLLPLMMAAQSDSAKLLKHTLYIAEEARTYSNSLVYYDSAITLLNQYEKYDSVSYAYKQLRLYICAFSFDTYMTMISGNVPALTDADVWYMSTLTPEGRTEFKKQLQPLRWYCTSFPVLKENAKDALFGYQGMNNLKTETLDRINKLMAL